MTKIVYLAGMTCAGKTTLMDKLKEDHPDDVHLVQVGKEFRRRYPPERFRGQAAMDDTEDEAFSIYKEQLEEGINKEFILVDGQPRLTSQVPRIWDHAVDVPKSVVWIHTTPGEIQRRLAHRFIDDESSLDLATKRLVNDKIQLFEVLFCLLDRGIQIRPFLNLSEDSHIDFWEFLHGRS